jgi:hypothetical protein
MSLLLSWWQLFIMVLMIRRVIAIMNLMIEWVRVEMINI